MIEELRLQNFKGFEDHVIPLNRLTMIVGANNAGKSTAVEALRLVSLVLRARRQSQFVAEPTWLEHEDAYRGIAPTTRGLEFDGDSFFYRYEPPPAIVRARFTGGASVTVFVGPEGQLHGVIADEHGHAVGSAAAARALEFPEIAVQPQVAPLSRNERVFNRGTVVRGLGTYLAPQHFRNQLKYFNDDYESFCELAEGTWPEFKVDEFEGLHGQPGDPLILRVRDRDFVAEASWMGHGLQMWLQTMWFLARTSNSACVILDEPDVYMHPDIQHRLLEQIRERFEQLLITTHSVELMASVDPADILIIDRSGASSAFATSLPAVQGLIDQMGGVHNLQLTRLFTADRFLLVEGDDLDLLRIFERTLQIKPTFVDLIPHGSTGGWGGWSLAISSKLPTTNNAGGKIVSYALFDCDHHADTEIDQRYKEADDQAVRLHVWRRKEIENYLLVPSAIARHIEDLLGHPGPNAAKIKKQIVKIANDLRDEVESDVGEKLFHLDRGGGFPKALKQAKLIVRNGYDNFEELLRILPGKVVLKELSLWSDDKYGVTFGPLRLAHALVPDEIDDEVSAVLTAIARREKFASALRLRRA